jgi:DNA replication protein DnaC
MGEFQNKELREIRRENEQLRRRIIAQVHAKFPQLAIIDEKIERIQREWTFDQIYRLCKADYKIKHPNLTYEEYTAILEQLKNEKCKLIHELKVDPNYDQPIFHCSICKDLGYITSPAKVCTCELNRIRMRKLEKVFRQSGLTPEQLRETFQNFNFEYYSETEKMPYNSEKTQKESISEIIRKAKEFSQAVRKGGKPKGIYLWGKSGMGKTYIASAIANELINAGVNVIYKKYDQLLAQIQKTYDRNYQGQNADELIETITSVNILILDDLGVEKPSSDSALKLYQIIDGRLTKRNPTVITSNYNIDTLGERYDDPIIGERISSRIIELCDVYQVMAKEDIRLLKSSNDYLKGMTYGRKN